MLAFVCASALFERVVANGRDSEYLPWHKHRITTAEISPLIAQPGIGRWRACALLAPSDRWRPIATAQRMSDASFSAFRAWPATT